jgi:hypothetical protein
LRMTRGLAEDCGVSTSENLPGSWILADSKLIVSRF